MKFLISPLLATLLLATTSFSASVPTIHCKDGKCFASFATPAKKSDKPAEYNQDLEMMTIVHYEIEQDEDFVPLEEEAPATYAPFNLAHSLSDIVEKPTKDMIEIEETTSEGDVIIAKTMEEYQENSQTETLLDSDEIVINKTEIEYVCDEGTSVICDVDTQICECA